MNNRLPPLVPVFRFSIVAAPSESSENAKQRVGVNNIVYRGAYPTLKNLRFLRRLRLRTLVSLVPEDGVTGDLATFCDQEEIDMHHFAVPKGGDLTPSAVAKILSILIDPYRLPVYLHCLDGTRITGLVVMTLRKLQNWTPISYQNEYLRFAKTKQVNEEDRNFVSLFSEEVSVPERIPSWLWGGVIPDAHPGGVRLKFGEHTLSGNSFLADRGTTMGS